MTETPLFYTGTFTADQLRVWPKMLTLGVQTGNSGVFRGQLTDLLVDNPLTNSIRVRTGRALIDNIPYDSNTSVTLAITSPVVGTTGGLVVLKKVWPTTTAPALAIHMNTDGTSAIPLPSQTDGTIWELPLASFTVTTGGAVSAPIDLRTYLAAPDPRRTLWVPVTNGPTAQIVGDFTTQQMSAASSNTAYMVARMPADFVTLKEAYVAHFSTSTGVIRRSVTTDYGGVGEAYNLNSGSVASSDLTVSTANAIMEGDISAALASLAAGDYLGVAWTRDGAHVNDVNTGTTHVLGLHIMYWAV